MENFATKGEDDHPSDQIDLPPGFRFHPTDEELITHYLSQKVLDSRFSAIAIGEADLNKSEPWDLPWRAKMGEKQWYFFCVRDRKYPTGLRTNRATEAGYWKATGKDKEIYRGKTLVGMKKTLVFYEGRAPKGVKSNWVMHEYRLEGKYSLFNLSKTSKNEWVICRVFEKGSSGKKIYVSSGIVRLECSGDELMGSSSTLLPPLMDSSIPPYNNNNSKESLRATKGETSHVTCFSNSMEDKKDEEAMIDCFTSFANPSSNPNPSDEHHQSNSLIFSKISHVPNNNYSNQSLSNMANFQYPCSVVSVQDDQDVFRELVESQGSVMKLQSCKAEREVFSISQETGLSADINNEISSVLSNRDMGIHSFDEEQEVPSTSAGPVDLGCLWSY